ncbi:hypothetical protein OHD16_25855 [Sphingobacterium sp. ML3W]|uniref:hypothetical protein n=1 Tax=Sphingobacterium sp. ML3W TaxID=1538644 RepID=UPI00249ADE3F|nr:hypothetical protein [Sphingobacterium sp. ML3W]WFA78130.1 hypothetical protein OGI71_18995 [Sphingobacterium sp. ML3W]
MKTNTKNLANLDGRLPYEAPCMNVQNIALEYSIAAGSVNSSVTESWQTETQTQEIDW